MKATKHAHDGAGGNPSIQTMAWIAGSVVGDRNRRSADGRGRNIRLLHTLADLAKVGHGPRRTGHSGALFNVPPAAIRAAVQRHPGAHERIDLVFLWPSLAPPTADGQAGAKTSIPDDGDAAPVRTDDRVFATIAGLGAVLPPMVRLRTIYPRYIEAQAAAGPDGLAIVPFRAGTPYEGEDLVYLAEKPEEFFALCSRPLRALPGTCIQERSVDAAEITLRFSREWLRDWRNTAAGFDRLVAQLHAPGT
jgi:hypothetical protein